LAFGTFGVGSIFALLDFGKINNININFVLHSSVHYKT